MLSSLPPELLHQIIESTVPQTFHTTTYDSRQRSLCSFSLVSKQFRAIAQPLLHEIVWIKSSKTFHRYKLRIGDAGEGDRKEGHKWRPQVVVIGEEAWGGSSQLSRDALSKGVLRVFSSAKSLTLDFDTDVPPKGFSFANFSNLSNLRLSQIPFHPDNVPKLPKLRSLTVFGVGPAFMAKLLDPTVVPNLKRFSLQDISEKSVRKLKRSCIADLLPQLEIFNLRLPIWRYLGFAYLHPAAERTLVDSEPFDLQQYARAGAKVIHLRFISTPLDENVIGISSGVVEEELRRLVSFIQHTPELLLRSLYLDSSLRPNSGLSHLITEVMDDLFVTCRERSIELIFETLPDDLRLDTWISAKFVERQKRCQDNAVSNRVSLEGEHGRGQIELSK
ncbi:hypothetical protein JCM5350_007870 [Sporobolomyces pararoseus]